MKAISYVIAGLFHLFIGLGRFFISLVSAVITIVGIIVLVVRIIFRVVGGFFWNLFSEGFQDTWNAIYARIGKPTCEICGKHKSRGKLVFFNDCCDRWAHQECHMSEKVAMMIDQGKHTKASAYFKLGTAGKLPIALRTLVQCLRVLRGPDSAGVFKQVARIKKMSTGMSLQQAMLVAFLDI
jgi:hypothetical protein